MVGQPANRASPEDKYLAIASGTTPTMARMSATPEAGEAGPQGRSPTVHRPPRAPTIRAPGRASSAVPAGTGGRKARLEIDRDEGIVILNDRRMPGSRSEIKFIAVAPAGVFVIDAKDVKGLVHTKRPGPLSALGPNELHVGRRNCTAMVGAVAQQVEAVREALSTKPWASDVPVHAILCLTRAQWGFASPLELGDVWIGWPQLVSPKVRSPAIMDSPMVNEVSLVLADRLPSA